MLEDRDAAVRSRALMLLPRAKTGQLRAAAERARLQELKPRYSELLLRLQEAQSCDPAEVERMILSNDDLYRKYGVAIADRLYSVSPHLLKLAAAMSADEDIREVAKIYVEND
jgi:hypothetical protein